MVFYIKALIAERKDTRMSDFEDFQNAPFPRYVFSALPESKGVAIVKQVDSLCTEQLIIPEDQFIQLVTQWKGLRKKESINKLEIARTIPSRSSGARALSLVDD